MTTNPLPYNRLATVVRLREKRILLGMTQEYVAERINRAAKYYADIERGYCGMSLETMLGLSECLDMSLDYMLLGKEHDGTAEPVHMDETKALVSYLDKCSGKRRRGVMDIIRIYLADTENFDDGI